MFPHQAIGIVHYDLPNGGTARVRHVWVGMVGRKSTETCNVKMKSCKKYCVSVVLVCPIEFLQLKQLSFGSNKQINWMFTRIPSLSQWTLADSFTISSLTWGVGWSVEKGLEQLHVFDVVNINGLFKAHHESLKNTQHAMLQRPCLKGKASKSVCDSKPWHSACVASWALTWSYMMTVKKKRIRPSVLFFMIGFFHVLFYLGKFIWWSENPDLQYLARTPLSVRPSREAGLAYLSVELDSEDVVGVTVVADLRPLLEMVDVHALRRRGAHHNYQTAGEKTLHDVNIRSFCWGQRTAGDQYSVSVPTGPLQTNDLNY